MIESTKIVLPALRGIMGDWIFYSCLMDMEEIGRRIHYASKIHKSEMLSDMIQRHLKNERINKIAQFLETKSDRFFNSLVVATYGGKPNWHALASVTSRSNDKKLDGLDDETISSIGFLTLRGDEKLFALDGQHRLAGIKKLMRKKQDSGQELHDELSVIFVAHQVSEEGRERTRRLFTTLNKTARPVSKSDIIALDEDDVMAICVRRLIEKTNMFSGSRIALVDKNNMPATNKEALTTIGNLYDILTILFTESNFNLKKRKPELRCERPSTQELDEYFKYAENYFKLMGKYIKELGDFYSAKDTTKIVSRYRKNSGGKVLFRPIGLHVFTQIIATLTQYEGMSLRKAIRLVSLLPRDLTKAPFAELMWNTSTSTIVNSNKVTLRETLLYMLGFSEKYSKQVLLDRYRKATGKDTARLPRTVV